MTRQKIVDQIKDAVHQVNPEVEIVLFGSQARKEANYKSDWDILILVDHPLQDIEDEKKYREAVFEVELETGQAISTFVLPKKDWETKYAVTPFYQNVQKDGILL